MKTLRFAFFYLILIAGLVALPFSSCKKDKDEPPAVTASKGELKAPRPKLPSVVTTDVTGNTTGNSVMCGGTVTLYAGASPVTDRGLVWGTDHNPTIENNPFVSCGTGTGTFSYTIENLIEDQIYFIHAYAVNADGIRYGGYEVVSVTDGSVSGSSCESFTDVRDGQTYNAVLIGDQCWMAENLNFGSMNPTGDEIQKYCYENIEANCDEYGALYTWDMAMGGDAKSVTNPSGVDGICPAGWHLPSFSEICQLTEEIGGKSNGGSLKEKKFLHWDKPNEGATDLYNFKSLGSGTGNPNTSAFGGLKTASFYWTTTGFTYYGDPGRQFRWTMRHWSEFDWQSHHYEDDIARSVRCIKD
jgi:uncharacterized protein (TIGR02145 family)